MVLSDPMTSAAGDSPKDTDMHPADVVSVAITVRRRSDWTTAVLHQQGTVASNGQRSAAGSGSGGQSVSHFAGPLWPLLQSAASLRAVGLQDLIQQVTEKTMHESTIGGKCSLAGAICIPMQFVSQSSSVNFISCLCALPLQCLLMLRAIVHERESNIPGTPMPPRHYESLTPPCVCRHNGSYS